jgi:hypothetical protein
MITKKPPDDYKRSHPMITKEANGLHVVRPRSLRIRACSLHTVQASGFKQMLCITSASNCYY